MFSETVIDGMMQRFNQPDVVMARLQYASGEEKQLRLCDVPSADKLEKFVEDVKFGVYPLTVFSGKKPPHFRSRAASPERIDSVKSATPEPVDIESRRIVNMMCSVKKLREDTDDIAMTILLRMDDKMNRQLTCHVTANDSAGDLTDELVRLGFVHIDDRDKIQTLLEETLQGSFVAGVATFEYGAQPLTFSATINEHAAAGLTGMSVSNMNMATEFTTTTTMGGLNENERSWSVAETEPHMYVDSGKVPATTTNIQFPTISCEALGGNGNGGGSSSGGSSNMQTAISSSNHSTPSPTASATGVIHVDAATLSSAASSSTN